LITQFLDEIFQPNVWPGDYMYGDEAQGEYQHTTAAQRYQGGKRVQFTESTLTDFAGEPSLALFVGQWWHRQMFCASAGDGTAPLAAGDHHQAGREAVE